MKSLEIESHRADGPKRKNSKTPLTGLTTGNCPSIEEGRLWRCVVSEWRIAMDPWRATHQSSGVWTPGARGGELLAE